MVDNTLHSLLSTKAALDLGLVTQADFDAVKNTFVRAQQIKSAVDVGLIKPEDYEETKQSFMDMIVSGKPATAAAAAAPQQPEPAAAPPPPVQRPAAVAWQLPPPAPPPSSTPAVQRDAPAAPLQNGAASIMPAAAAGGAAAAAPAPSAMRTSASSTNLPSNIPKMGGAKSMSQGTSMSGISVSEDAVNLFYLMRLKATYKWALWQVDDSGASVIIAAVGEKGSTWQDFLAALPDADCRYGVFDFDFETPDGQKLHKMIFLNWAPDAARVKAKMMYASTKDFFKSHLDGLSLEFQASDLDEISEQEVGDAVRAMKRG